MAQSGLPAAAPAHPPGTIPYGGNAGDILQKTGGNPVNDYAWSNALTLLTARVAALEAALALDQPAQDPTLLPAPQP